MCPGKNVLRCGLRSVLENADVTVKVSTLIRRSFRVSVGNDGRIVLTRRRRDAWLFLTIGILGILAFTLIGAGGSKLWPRDAEDTFGWDVFFRYITLNPRHAMFYFFSCVSFIVVSTVWLFKRNCYVVGPSYLERIDSLGSWVIQRWLLSHGVLSRRY